MNFIRKTFSHSHFSSLFVGSHEFDKDEYVRKYVAHSLTLKVEVRRCSLADFPDSDDG